MKEENIKRGRCKRHLSYQKGKSVKKDEVKTEEDVKRYLCDKRTRFETDVLLATFKIPKGKVSTYKRIAEKIGKPKAHRAVANALHKNPLHPVVPCHRVVRSDGGFGGEQKAAADRRNLVKNEGVPVENSKVKINKQILY
jgi:methylated-DNA-[protein]-cysteine S-methyltransferase